MPKLSFQYVRQGNVENLLAFLVRRFRYHTDGEWEERIRKGFVKVNGRKAKPGQILETRHKIVYEPPPAREPEVDPTFEVIYEDDCILAVSKSGNIPTSPSGKYWNNCLTHVLKDRLKLEWVHAVHRLDRETSGLNLFAKSKQAAGRLGRSFAQGEVGKIYSAMLRGRLPSSEIFVSAPLRNAEGGAIRIKQAVHAQGRESATRFQLRAVLPGACLVRAVPLTGRTHQIRAHAALLGHPVVGDKLYGTSEEAFLRWVGEERRESAGRQLLHSTSLTFPHPATGEGLTLTVDDAGLVQQYLSEPGYGLQLGGVI
jgi:RluA family pseudouridine synthase